MSFVRFVWHLALIPHVRVFEWYGIEGTGVLGGVGVAGACVRGATVGGARGEGIGVGSGTGFAG